MGAVLFDIGSTLVDGPELSPAGTVASLLGLEDTEKGRVADILMCRSFEDHRQVCGCLMEALPAPSLQEEEIKKIWFDQESAPREIPGATGAVRYVREAGFRVGLVSDIWAPYYRGFISACPELAKMVDYAGLSFREGVRKPSDRLFKSALAALGVTARESWMVGDTYFNDLLPAIQLGIGTVWVLSRPEKEYRAMEGILKGRLPRPDVIIDTVADLIGFDFQKQFRR